MFYFDRSLLARQLEMATVDVVMDAHGLHHRGNRLGEDIFLDARP